MSNLFLLKTSSDCALEIAKKVDNKGSIDNLFASYNEYIIKANEN